MLKRKKQTENKLSNLKKQQQQQQKKNNPTTKLVNLGLSVWEKTVYKYD